MEIRLIKKIYFLDTYLMHLGNLHRNVVSFCGCRNNDGFTNCIGKGFDVFFACKPDIAPDC